MNAELEREILGHLILKAELLESSELPQEGLFSTPDTRRAFAGISAL